MLQVYSGNGKGKTTAALGLAIRAAGAGKRVGIIYFDKGGAHYSERKILEEKFKGLVDFFATGLDRIDPATGRFRFGATDEDIAEAQRGLAYAHEWMQSSRYDLLILDEINSTVALGMLTIEAVLQLLDELPENLELVFTGRNAPKEFLERANLVTEMNLVKHYFYHGVRAREGFDF